MNKSNLFKQAHALTKATIKTGDNYAATFAICLKLIIAATKEKVAAFMNLEKMIAFHQKYFFLFLAKVLTPARAALQKAVTRRLDELQFSGLNYKDFDVKVTANSLSVNGIVDDMTLTASDFMKKIKG